MTNKTKQLLQRKETGIEKAAFNDQQNKTITATPFANIGMMLFVYPFNDQQNKTITATIVVVFQHKPDVTFNDQQNKTITATRDEMNRPTIRTTFQ